MTSTPHIIRFIAHDVGQHIGCYGVDTVDTTNLDSLANEGIKFENSFCVAPQCSPSRASIATGRYPHSNGVMGLAHDGFAWELHDDESHISSLLSDNGWHSALAGIHHATTSNEAFDEVVTDEGSAETVAAAAVNKIKNHTDGADHSSPLHLQVGFFEPHRVPSNPSEFPTPSIPDSYNEMATLPEYLVEEQSARDEMRAFEAAIERMDAAVGKVLDTLEKRGILDNTVVLATTDHGIPFPRAKCSLYDPGLETFLIARWPDVLPTGETYRSTITTVDHLPTMFDWLDIEIPDAVQGVSHADTITNSDSSTDSPRETFFSELTHHDYTDPRRAIRTPDYKCIVNFTNAPFIMDPSQKHRPGTIPKDPSDPKLAFHPPIELYDLTENPQETENVAEDLRYEDVLTDLLDRLDQWMQETNDPLLQGIPTPPIYDAAISALNNGSVVDPRDN